MTTRRCILVADKVSTAVLGPKMVGNGLWSVPRWKGRPYSSSSGHQYNSQGFLLYLRVVPFSLGDCSRNKSNETLFSFI